MKNHWIGDKPSHEATHYGRATNEADVALNHNAMQFRQLRPVMAAIPAIRGDRCKNANEQGFRPLCAGKRLGVARLRLRVRVTGRAVESPL